MFAYPLTRNVLTSRFIYYAPFGTRKMHYGIDLGCNVGTPVKAGNTGRVIFSAYDSAGGNMIIVQGDNELTRYAHLSARHVEKGDTVNIGDVIGMSGATGTACAGAHLHFETWITPDGYTYKYDDRTKYAVDPVSVCHLLPMQTYSNNGLPTADPIPYPEPKPEKTRVVTGTVTVINGGVRVRVIPETLKYSALVGGDNRTYTTWGDFFPLGVYECTATADNDANTWALVKTPRGAFWVALIDGYTVGKFTEIEPEPEPIPDDVATLQEAVKHLTAENEALRAKIAQAVKILAET